MVLAVDEHGVLPQQAGQQRPPPHRDGMDFRPVVIVGNVLERLDVLIQRAAQHDVHHLNAPADAQHRLVCREERPQCGHQCSAYLYQFLIELHRVVNLQNGSQDGQKLNQLQPVIDYIDKNFRKELTLVELADLIDLSPQYLCRLFKECLSLRPFEYLARKRIQQAKLLLLEDKLNINEIAAEVGYNDCSYFCAVFKKHEMLSPAEFRSLHKKAGN